MKKISMKDSSSLISTTFRTVKVALMGKLFLSPSRHIFSLNMKVSSILVISVIIKLQHRVISRDIFSLNMKASSILVINVIIKLLYAVILTDTKSLNMLTEK